MIKDTVNRAAEKVSEGIKLAAEATELYSLDNQGATRFAEMALNEFKKANEIAEYLSYEEKRLIDCVTGQATFHLREIFGL